MATHLLEDGMNIYQISKFLGHESVQTTMIYLGFMINMRNNSIRQVESTTASVIKPRWNANIRLQGGIRRDVMSKGNFTFSFRIS